jgi:hypothetical protein
MKKTKHALAILFLALFTTSGVLAAPVPIFPGSEGGEEGITVECPTFKWSPAEKAILYRLDIFESSGSELLPYEEMKSIFEPLLSSEVAGYILSWTPSLNQCLSKGNYVWYVKWIDNTGQGAWSKGMRFLVDEEISRAAMKEEAGGPEIGTNPADDNEIVPQLTEVPHNTFVGDNAGGSVTSGDWNTFVGYQAGKNITTVSFNTFVGVWAGYTNSTGQFNTFMGIESGYTNSSGDNNTFIGYYSGHLNTGGKLNTFLGHYAGEQNQTGDNNTFIGSFAGLKNKADGNTYVGYKAGYFNTNSTGNTFVGNEAGLNNNGFSNTFVGHYAGHSNDNGVANTFFGVEAGSSNIDADHNTFVGYWAGKENTGGDNTFLGYLAGEGKSASSSGVQNTFLGTQAGENNESAGSNTFVGYKAGNKNTGGYSNTFLGVNAGLYNQDGSSNTFVGNGAGQNNETGDANVFIGYKAGPKSSEANVAEKLYINNNEGKPLIYGDFSTGNKRVNIYGGFKAIATSVSSDQRLKKDIQPINSPLESLMNLSAVSYKWKTDQYPDMGFDEKRHIGVIAQDVEKEFPELVTEDKDGFKSVSYAKLTAVLLEAVKKLKEMNDDQKSRIEEQQAEIKELRLMIEKSKS